jgi:hypothetical protein
VTDLAFEARKLSLADPRRGVQLMEREKVVRKRVRTLPKDVPIDDFAG